jgi:hypothetical protein
MISTADDPFLYVPDCPVIDEFFRQVRNERYRLDLTALWIAAGKPEGFEPRFWCKAHNSIGGMKPLKTICALDRHAEAMGTTAALYAMDCDERISDAFEEHYRPRYGRNVVKAIICEPTRLVGMLAICDVMNRQDISPTVAADAILAEVARDDEGELGVFERETIVARVHRALRGDQQLPHPRNPHYWSE